MPDYAGSSSAIIAAAPDEVYALMLDYDRLPTWMRSVRSARSLQRDDQGRAIEVAYEVDVRVGLVHYTLHHTYDAPREISSVYVDGDFRDCSGRWTFKAVGDGRTEACFELRIDPGRAIPKPIVKMMNRQVMKGSVDDLRRHFGTRGAESPSSRRLSG